MNGTVVKNIVENFKIIMNVKRKYNEWVLLVRSQTYNEFFDFSYFIDTLLSPAFWFVDNWAGFIGPGFVISVYLLTFLVVLFAYRIGIPYYWSLNPIFCLCLIVIGHWILINVLFNYVMAVKTKPGFPPPIDYSNIYSICKKCFNSKPARTHHCSICDRCILKMDHHCPWINNCVGFYNHRYFYLYMVYLLIGVIFLTIFGCHLAIDLIFYDNYSEENDVQIEGYVVNINDIKDEIFLNSIIDDIITYTLPYFKKLIVYVALIVLGVLISISYFVYYHGMLITKGETSIEELINQKERTRLINMNCTFENPYDFGFRNNWRLFFGIKKHQSFIRHILLPSKYQPLNDGINWPTIYNCDISNFLS